MNQDLFSIVYCSRNLISGDRTEVSRELRGILASARKNNARAGVTGALLYSAGSFAQVLEGPLQSIERIFESIQRDPRHSEVTVVQSGPLNERRFSEWSMAFSGGSPAEETPVATAAFEAVFAHAAQAGERILSLMYGLVLSDGELQLPDVA